MSVSAIVSVWKTLHRVTPQRECAFAKDSEFYTWKENVRERSGPGTLETWVFWLASARCVFGKVFSLFWAPVHPSSACLTPSSSVQEWLKNVTAAKSLVVVQSLSCVRLFVIPWTTSCQASLSITNSQDLLKLMSIQSVMPSNPLILCHPLLLLPSVFSSTRASSNESALRIRWPKYWSFSSRPSNKCSGLISFRIYWFDLLAVQGTLKSLLQCHILKALILEHSAFLMVQLSHL